MKSGKTVYALLLFVWMLFLHLTTFAETSQSPIVDIQRVKKWGELKPIHLGFFLTTPLINLQPALLSKDDIPDEFHKDKFYEEIVELFKLQESGEFEQAYIQSDKILKKMGKSGLAEWLSFLKADLLYQVQKAKDEPRLSLALEDYQDAIRRYPLHTQYPRILYQTGLIQLELKFFQDVEETMARSIREYGGSEFAPRYYLLRGEASFQKENYPQAVVEFNTLIEKFPRSQAAVDAAFRKAFIHFRKSEFERALLVYKNLEKFHSEEIEKLRMRKDSSEIDKFLDRVYYAETIFLNGLYDESAKLFQDLANLFPSDPISPLLLVRLGDTYFERGQFRAADQLYKLVLEQNSSNPIVQSFGKIHRADLLFLTRDLRAHRENEKLYEEAVNAAEEAGKTELAAFALARLSAHLLYFEAYPKAQGYLKIYLDRYLGSLNTEWAEKQFVKTIEVEMIDYYKRGDYMAALATYLVTSKSRLQGLNDTQVLIALSDAAKKLSLFDKATEILNRVIYLEKSANGRQEALLRLVELLIVQGEYKKASERLRRFSFAYPKTSLAYLYERLWGDLYTALKNPGKSVSHYEKALDLAKSDPALVFEMREIHLKLASHFKELALPLRAVESYESYISLVSEAQNNPLSERKTGEREAFQSRVSRYKIADLFFDMRDYVRALDGYKTIVKEIKQEPFASHARFRIGECYLALGDRKAALEIFKEIKAEDANNIWARAAQSYIKTVEMEVKYGIRIIN